MKINRLILAIALTLMVSPVFAASTNGQGTTNGNAPAESTATSAATADTVTSTTANSNGNSGATNSTSAGTQSQNENQVRTQTQASNPETGLMTQTQTEEQTRIEKEVKSSKPTYSPKNTKSEANRSVVANAAEALVRLANKEENHGIGSQIKVIAQTQSQNQDKIGKAIDKTETRTGIAKFFIGANFEELSKAKATMEQNRTQIKELEQLMTQLTNDTDKVEIANQIILLQNQQIELRDQLADLASGFSLFGWIARWHNHFSL